MNSENISILRKQIDRIDAGILQMVARRLQVAQRIGRVKQAQALPVQDARRERSLLADRMAQGAARGISQPVVRDIMRALLRASRRAQRAGRRKRL